MSRPHLRPVLYVTSRQPKSSAKLETVYFQNQLNRPDSNTSVRLPVMLVNRPAQKARAQITIFNIVLFRRLFSRTRPLTGAPTTRRLKTYSAESGYVYHYFYEGHREFEHSRQKGTEFVFSISADRKTWHNLGVFVADAALQSWQVTHERELSSTERYAIAKMALFRAFDSRETPDQMTSDISVQAADVETLVEKLSL